MTLQVEVQQAGEGLSVPDEDSLTRWARLAFRTAGSANYSVVLRLTDESESRQLNNEYRGRDYATNVLSFPFETPEFIDEKHLGDLVICAPVVNREAGQQGKSSEAHWAHMVIHGMLHLQGYDHLTDDEAAAMESLETELLSQLDIANPYED